MKKIAKILSAGLSALMLMSVAASSVGAVSEKDCLNSNVIAAVSNCNLSDCGNIQSVINQFCSGGSCDVNSLIGLINNGNACPGGKCDTTGIQQNTPSGQNTEKPQIDPVKPVTNTEDTDVSVQKPSLPDNNTVSSEFNEAYENEVIRLVNAERAKYGLSPLKRNEGAVSVAHVRAKEIVRSFSHTRPDGSSCFTAAKELGVSYSSAGENIAYGYADPKQVVNGWMNSEGHRKNILSASFTSIGVGCYSNGGVLYWSQFFIG